MRKPIARLLSLPFFLFVSIALFFGAYGVPAAAHADTTCNTPTIGNFVPHIHGGHLDSFDYSISDPGGTSYLPLSTSINGKGIDLDYVSVWHNVGTNTVKIHVDVPDEMALSRDLTISIGDLQLTQGPPPICLSQATFHVNLPHVYTSGIPGTAQNPITSYPGQPVTNPTHATTPVHSNPTPNYTTTTPATTSIGTPALSVGGECNQLGIWWLVLLALLDILVSIVLLLLMSFIAHSNARLIAAVLLPPVVFIAIWYFVNTCHTDIWFPILAVILAIIILSASGTPEYFETYRQRITRFFGKRTKDTQLKLAEASSIMEVR